MYVVLVAGGIASGKSTAARVLERRGAVRIDLDELSRRVLEPGSGLTQAVAEEFGVDLLDARTGALDRALLARRAFATPEATARLEELELPAIRQLLADELARLASADDAPACCVVEVPLLDRLEGAHELADEVLVVGLPVGERRQRAVGRGMDAADFDARAARQPSDEWLLAHADTVIPNDGTAEELVARLDAWWDRRAARGWMAGEASGHGA